MLRPRLNFEEAAGSPFSFEGFDEGEVGDASPWWWAGTVRVGHLANMSISRSLHRSGLRGTVDPVFVQTASLSRPPTFHRAQELSAFASQRVMQVGLVDAVGEEEKTGGLTETRSQQLWVAHSRESHSQWCGHCSREVVVLV